MRKEIAKRLLIEEIEELVRSRHKIAEPEKIVKFLGTLIEPNELSEKSLRRYFIANKQTGLKQPVSPDKATVLCKRVLGLRSFEDYVFKKEYENNVRTIPKNLYEIPKELSTIPLIKTDDVIGRDKELIKLKSDLEEKDRVVLVNGIGGIGKTTLAKYFINTLRRDFDYVSWIDITGSIKESFVSRIDLIDSLNLSAEIDSIKKEGGSTDESFQLIINRMRQLSTGKDSQNLLILDNVESEIEELDILDAISLNSNWKVIVTSRERLESLFNFPVGVLSKEDAKRLFYFHYKKEVNDDLVEQILKEIDYHTLGIEIISKTSNALRYTLKTILKTLKKKGLNISPAANVRLRHNNNRQIQSVIEYLLKIFSVAKLSSQQQWVLMQFTLLPSMEIPYLYDHKHDLISLLNLSKRHEKDNFTLDLNSITEKGWLQWDSISDTFKLHSLIREVLILTLEPNPHKCKTLIASLNSILDYQNLDYTAFIYSQDLDSAIKRGYTLEYAEFLDNFSNVAIRLSKYDAALKFHNKALNIRMDNDASDKELSDSYNGLALAYKGKGNLHKSLEFQLKDLELTMKESEEESYEIAITYNNLSLIYRLIPGKLKEAYVYQRKAIKITEKLEDVDLQVIVYNNMGNLLYNEAKHKESVPYFEKSLDYRIKKGDELWTAEGYANLAFAQVELNLKSQAIENFEVALETLKNYDDTFLICRIYIHMAMGYSSLKNSEMRNKYIDLYDSTIKKLEIKSVTSKQLKNLKSIRNSLVPKYD